MQQLEIGEEEGDEDEADEEADDDEDEVMIEEAVFARRARERKAHQEKIVAEFNDLKEAERVGRENRKALIEKKKAAKAALAAQKK